MDGCRGPERYSSLERAFAYVYSSPRNSMEGMDSHVGGNGKFKSGDDRNVNRNWLVSLINIIGS